jgi:predicted component of type VI protein secretion system
MADMDFNGGISTVSHCDIARSAEYYCLTDNSGLLYMWADIIFRGIR